MRVTLPPFECGEGGSIGRNNVCLTPEGDMKKLIALSAFALLIATTAFAQAPAAQEGRGGGRGAGARVTRPPLFFKEEWKQTDKGGEHPIDFASALSNSNLELKVYGPTAKELLMTGAAN